MASVGDIKDLIDLSVECAKIIKTFVSDVRQAKNRQEELFLEAASELDVISLYEKFLEKLPAEQVDAIGFRLRRMRDGAKELQALLDTLKKYGSVDWALRRKKKVETICDQIKEDQDQLSLRLIALRVFADGSDRVNGSSETEKLVSLIQKSIARRQETLQLGAHSLELSPSMLPTRGQLSTVEGSELLVGTGPRGSQLVIEEYPFVSHKERGESLERISDMASAFHADTPEERSTQALTANVPNCIGYLALPKSFQLVCEMPPDVVQVQSLRQLLKMPNNHSLNSRLDLAKSLAKGIFFTHAFRYVHKSIRPSNIIVAHRSGKDTSATQADTMGHVLLAGFGAARAEQGTSTREGDGKKQYELDLYRHPSRIDEQGGVVLDRYTFLHDVYSLGVCLLEIGLWEDLLDHQRFKSLHAAQPLRRQTWFEARAKRDLPREMGQTYSNVVLRCLQGVDGGFLETPGHGFDDTSVGLGYIEAVLDDLGRIAV